MKNLIARIRRFTSGVPFYRWPIKFFKNRRAAATRGRRKKGKLKTLRRFDRRHKVDFGGYIPPDALGNGCVDGNAYEPSYPMPNLLKALRVLEGDCLMDVGCGKGYAMYSFAELPFSRIDGLEYNHQLAEIARKNFARLFPGSERFHVYEGDAALWSDYDRYTFIYLYNPFKARVVERVCDELVESLRRAPRRLTIVYQAPFHWDVLKARGFLPVMQMDGAAVFTPRTELNKVG